MIVATGTNGERRRRSTVLHVLATAALDGIAQATIVRALAHRLDPERYALQAWFLEPGPLQATLAEAGVPNRGVSFGGGRDLRGALSVANATRIERPAIVHLHAGGGSLVWLTRRLAHARIVVHLHGSYDESGNPLSLRPFVHGADAVIATSSAVAARSGLEATVVYPGISAPPEAPPAPTSDAATVGSVGRLAAVKGYEVLIAAVERLCERDVRVRVELAGHGPAAQSLRAQVSRLGLNDVVTFLGWQTDLRPLHLRWSAFVAPSIHEGFGLAALEAMGAGLPVIASAVDGLPELVEHGRTGWLIPPGDPTALADAIEQSLADPGRRLEMGVAARAAAEQRFPVETMVRSIEAIYDRLLGS